MFGLLFSFSCTQNNIPVETETVHVVQAEAVTEPRDNIDDVDDDASCSLLIEEITSEPIIQANNINPYRHLLHSDETVYVWDEATAQKTQLGTYAHSDGSPLTDSSSLLALDGELHTFDGQWLSSSPLNDLLPVPISTLHRANERLWLWGAGQLFHWHDQTLPICEQQGMRT